MAELDQRVSTGIQTLTLATFDRVQAHVARYAEDERRQSHEGNGVVMRAHESIITDLGNRYGFMELKICQPAAKLAVAKSIISDPIISTLLTELDMPQRSDLDFTEGASREGLTAQIDPRIRVLRDRYAHGWTGGLGDPEFWAGEDYNPHVLGERHRIGLAARVVLKGATIPGIERWDIGFSLSDRFDKPGSQTKSSVKIRKISPDTKDREEIERGAYERETKRATTIEDIEFMSRVLEGARDVRPVVDRIRSHVSYGNFLNEMHAKIYGDNVEDAA